MSNTYYTDNNLSNLKEENFRKTVQGKETKLFLLKNADGMEVAVTNYGGAMLSIMVPDRHGRYANVILSNDTIDNVINSPEPFLNTIIGRYGNRIGNARFTLNGKVHQLDSQNGTYTLHGGTNGFHTRVWDAEQSSQDKITLHYLSADGEAGFPGNLSVTVSYQLSCAGNAIEIEYHATTDKDTVINLTSHGFFNLAGTADPTPTVLNNIVTINADHYIPIDKDSIPTGEILSVHGTPMDFTTPHAIGERINDNYQQLINGTGYDHCYVLNKPEAKTLTLAATCIEPVSGRKMEVFTTEAGVQLYTGNWLNGFKGAYGATYPARSAICFEAQCFPDSPNKSYFPSCVLRKGEEYYQKTIYRFSTVQE